MKEGLSSTRATSMHHSQKSQALLAGRPIHSLSSYLTTRVHFTSSCRWHPLAACHHALDIIRYSYYLVTAPDSRWVESRYLVVRQVGHWKGCVSESAPNRCLLVHFITAFAPFAVSAFVVCRAVAWPAETSTAVLLVVVVVVIVVQSPCRNRNLPRSENAIL